VSGVCTRNGLSAALDSYFNNAITKTPLKLSPSLKISSNGYIQASINATAYGNITSLYRLNFKVQALDTAVCQAARYTVVTERNSTTGKIDPALVTIRIKLDDHDGPMQEIEVMNIERGQHILFYPDKFEQTTPTLFSSPQISANSTTAPLRRAEIIAVANTYLDGVQGGNNALVHAGPTCPRISNGLRTSSHCDQGLQQFKWPVDNRRWIADTETGVAFGVFIFRGALTVNNQTGDYINEYLVVKDGKIREIRATMIYTLRNITAVWPEDKDRKYPAL
jgi:hypothetical protein